MYYHYNNYQKINLKIRKNKILWSKKIFINQKCINTVILLYNLWIIKSNIII